MFGYWKDFLTFADDNRMNMTSIRILIFAALTVRVYPKNIAMISGNFPLESSDKKHEHLNEEIDFSSYLKQIDDLSQFGIHKTWAGQNITTTDFNHKTIANQSFAATSNEAMAEINKINWFLKMFKEHGDFESHVPNDTDEIFTSYTELNSHNVHDEALINVKNRKTPDAALSSDVFEVIDNASWLMMKYSRKYHMKTRLHRGEINPLERLENRSYLDHADPLSKYLLQSYSIEDEKNDTMAYLRQLLSDQKDQFLQKRY